MRLRVPGVASALYRLAKQELCVHDTSEQATAMVEWRRGGEIPWHEALPTTSDFVNFAVDVDTMRLETAPRTQPDQRTVAGGWRKGSPLRSVGGARRFAFPPRIARDNYRPRSSRIKTSCSASPPRARGARRPPRLPYRSRRRQR